jgi:predicted transposase/invertase (TIGR01784 family)
MKRLLRNKANFGILNGFLSELLKEKIEVQQILESEGNQESVTDKYNKLDLLCINNGGEIIAIEVQYYEESDYFHRCLYGTSKLITEHLSKGETYAQVKKIYSINILYFDLGSGDDYIYVGRTQFSGLNNAEELLLSENQQVKFGKNTPDEIFPVYYTDHTSNIDQSSLCSVGLFDCYAGITFV